MSGSEERNNKPRVSSESHTPSGAWHGYDHALMQRQGAGAGLDNEGQDAGLAERELGAEEWGPPWTEGVP